MAMLKYQWAGFTKDAFPGAGTLSSIAPREHPPSEALPLDPYSPWPHLKRELRRMLSLGVEQLPARGCFTT